MKIIATIRDYGHTGKVAVAFASYISDDGELSSAVEVDLSGVADRTEIETKVQDGVLADANTRIGKGSLTLADIIVTGI